MVRAHSDSTVKVAEVVADDLSLDGAEESTLWQVRQWLRDRFPWWATSLTVHVVGLSLLLLVGGTAALVADQEPVLDGDVPVLAKAEPVEIDIPLEKQDVMPSVDVSLDKVAPPEVALRKEDNGPEDIFIPRGGSNDQKSTVPSIGGGTGVSMPAIGAGPAVTGNDRVAGSFGPDKTWGSGGGPGGIGFANRQGHIDPKTGDPLTRGSDVPIAFALRWLARHQAPEGNWSLMEYNKRCKDRSCTGAGVQESLTAATAMSVLPFLAAGQTPTKGFYSDTVRRAMYWLVDHQKKNGDLSVTSETSPHTWMYSHGLATIALCECYAMSRIKERPAGEKSSGSGPAFEWTKGDVALGAAARSERSTSSNTRRTSRLAVGAIVREMRETRRSSVGN